MNSFLKIFFLSAFLSISLSAISSPVDESKAKLLASRFLSENGPISNSSVLTRVYSSISPATVSDDTYYIFNYADDAFIIIAGDDSVSPVLAYSDSGTFVTDDMPSNVRYWFEMWDDIINSNIQKGVKADENIAAEWDLLENTGKQMAYSASSKLLPTADWNQRSPYNDKCPSFGGKTSLTGCVATATAIMMRYFCYPESGVGTIPSYDYNLKGEKREIPSVILGEKYDWDNMPFKYTEHSTSAQKAAVSTLMYHIGTMVQMNYDSSSSGAYTEDVAKALKTYMGFDKSSEFYFSSYFTSSAWIAKLKNHIDNTGPVVYGAQSKSGGHAFILDGYNTSNQFHINWGWGGIDNGYYTWPSFDEYTTGHLAVFAKPDVGGKADPVLTIDNDGISSDTGSFSPGKTFNLYCNLIYNISMDEFDGYVGIGRIDKDGNISEVIGKTAMKFSPLSGFSLSWKDKSFESINDGDYMTIVSLSNEVNEWRIANYNTENPLCVHMIYLSDSHTLDEVTSLKYSASDKKLVISTKADACWSLVNSKKTDASSAATWDGKGVLTIDAKLLVKDNYTLTLSKGSDVKEVILTIGAK